MRILPWRSEPAPAADANPSYAIPAPRRREPSAPLFGMRDVDDAISFRDLPSEDRNLLTAYPAATGPAGTGPAARGILWALAVTAVLRRPPCQILAVYYEEEARRARFAFEVGVGQNLAMLADQDRYGVSS